MELSRSETTARAQFRQRKPIERACIDFSFWRRESIVITTVDNCQHLHSVSARTNTCLPNVEHGMRAHLLHGSKDGVVGMLERENPLFRYRPHNQYRFGTVCSANTDGWKQRCRM